MPKVKAKRVVRKQSSTRKPEKKGLTPQQKAARTRAANKRAAELLKKKRSEAAKRGYQTRLRREAEEKRAREERKRAREQAREESFKKKWDTFLTRRDEAAPHSGRGGINPAYRAYYKEKNKLRSSLSRKKYVEIMQRIGAALNVANVTVYIES